jgi:hypothetical protein
MDDVAGHRRAPRSVHGSRILAVALVVAIFGVTILVGVYGSRYELRFNRMATELPPLTHWAIRAYTYTPLFLLAAFPAILCAISRRLGTESRFISLALASLGLALLVVWAALMWLGLGLPLYKLDTVLG